MKFNAQKVQKSDKQIIEEVLPAYLLFTAMSNLHKDNSNKYIPGEYLQLLMNSAMATFEGLPPKRIKKVYNKLQGITSSVLRSVNMLDTYNELCLTIARLNVELLKKNKIRDVNSQGVLIAASIMEEAAEFKDWGSLKKAKNAAERLENAIFQEGLFNGTDT